MKDIEQLTDAEIAREMAEADGWRVEIQGEYWSGVIYHAQNHRTGEQHTSQIREFAWSKALQNTNYPRSLDAAVGWLGRRGLYWSRHQGDNNPSVAVSGGLGQRPCIWKTCYESPTCSTARALCNAGLAAWREQRQAKEAKK